MPCMKNNCNYEFDDKHCNCVIRYGFAIILLWLNGDVVVWAYFIIGGDGLCYY